MDKLKPVIGPDTVLDRQISHLHSLVPSYIDIEDDEYFISETLALSQSKISLPIRENNNPPFILTQTLYRHRRLHDLGRGFPTTEFLNTNLPENSELISPQLNNYKNSLAVTS